MPSQVEIVAQNLKAAWISETKTVKQARQHSGTTIYSIIGGRAEGQEEQKPGEQLERGEST